MYINNFYKINKLIIEHTMKIWEINLNKLCFENNFPVEKEREVLSMKFPHILSL